MKPSHVAEALKTLVLINQPVFVWGPPGVGKSQVVQQTAQTLTYDAIETKLKKSAKALSKKLSPLHYDLRDIRAVLLDPVDLRGLPTINGDNRAHWCPPEFLPREGKGILFLDELNAAPPLVQAACYQLVLDRKLGEYHLPDGWAVVAAGNRESDKAVTHRMPSALANRFVHINFEVDLNDWVVWALDKGIMTEVIAFLQWRPALLHAFDPSKNDKAFATPRSWESVSNMLKQTPSKDIEYELIKGAVGEGAAAELLGFLKIFRGLPNPDAVLMNPDQADVPTDPATLYAICGALAPKASEQTMGRLVKYANRLPAEFSVLLVRDSIRNDNNVVNSRAYIEWASAHSDVLI